MDLATINKLRQLDGKEPLTELPKADGEGGGGGETETPEQKETKRIAAEAEAAKAKEKETGAGEVEKIPGELSDEDLLALLNKRGITAGTLEDLKKKEVIDPAVLAEQREAAELAFGLSKGLFNKKEYDQFVADSQDPQNLVYAEYHADSLKEDATLTDEEIQAEFLSKYGLDTEKDSRKFKRGLKEIKALATSMLNAKYGKILKAKDAYTSHETSVQSTAARDQKIAAALPVYKKDVEEIFTALKKIPVKFSDADAYEVEAMEEDLNALRVDMMKPEFYAGKLEAGYDKETLKQSVFAGFLYKNFAKVVAEVSNQHLKKHAAGSKGITLEVGGKKEDLPALTPAQQKYADMHNASKVQ